MLLVQVQKIIGMRFLRHYPHEEVVLHSQLTVRLTFPESEGTRDYTKQPDSLCEPLLSISSNFHVAIVFSSAGEVV